jgi:AcrR family transcriptional regulator
MTRSEPISPRKVPQQDRSNGLVDAIFTATSRVLMNLGFERASTSRIAEVAGVSIGSLYQYFPNKHSLVAALIERQVEKHTREIETEIEAMEDRSLDEVLAAVIRKVSQVFLARRKLIRAVQVHAPALGRVEVIISARRKVGQIVRRILESRKSEIRDLDPDQAAFVIINAVMGVVDMAILDFPEGVTERDLETHLLELVRSYLRVSD